MKRYFIVLVVVLAACTQPVQNTERDRELESLRVKNGTQAEVIKALREKVDRLEIDLEHAVNRKCPVSAPVRPRAKRQSIGVA